MSETLTNARRTKMKFMLVSKDQKGEGLILGGSHSTKIESIAISGYESDFAGSREVIWGYTPLSTFRDGASRGISKHLDNFYVEIANKKHFNLK